MVKGDWRISEFSVDIWGIMMSRLLQDPLDARNSGTDTDAAVGRFCGSWMHYLTALVFTNEGT